MWDEKLSTDKDAAEKYVDKLSSLVKSKNLAPQQIYNIHDTRLFLHCFPRNKIAKAHEHSMFVMKKRVTVIASANVAGTQV